MDRYRRFFCLVCVILIMTTAQAWTDGASPSRENSYQPELPSPLGGRSEGLRTEKILAAQVSLFYGQNLDEVEGRIARLAEAGVNTLIVRVFQNEGDRPYRFASPQHATGVYFQTQYAPVVDDILAPVARIARRHGLRVFAWMTTRHANYGFEGNGALRAVLYDFETDTMVPARGFNLFRTEVVTRLTGLYSDLARYPIDGILFQDDLILRHNEGFSPEARQLFFEDHGFMSNPAQFYGEISREDDGKIVVSRYTDRFWIWARWKNWKLMNLAERLMDAGRRIKPDLQFAINLYYESVLDPEKGMAWYSQSLEMARELPFDYFSIMAYHRQMREELELTMEEALNLLPHLADRAVKMAGDPARVLMKIQVVDWNDSTLLPKEETEMALRAVGEKPGIHIALVPYQPDLPTKSLIRSLDLPLVGMRQGGGTISPIATRELLPTSFHR
jgi:biofilm PGA synthesis lipoprotein PgaB